GGRLHSRLRRVIRFRGCRRRADRAGSGRRRNRGLGDQSVDQRADGHLVARLQHCFLDDSTIDSHPIVAAQVTDKDSIIRQCHTAVATGDHGKIASLVGGNQLIGHSATFSWAPSSEADMGDSPLACLSPVICTMTWIWHFSATADGRIFRTAAARTFSSAGNGLSGGFSGEYGSFFGSIG